MAPASASRLLPGTPAPEIVAAAGTLRIQLPVAQGAVTAIGYHGGAEGALGLQPLGRQGNEGLSPVCGTDAGSTTNDLVHFSSAARLAPARRRSTSGHPPERTILARRRNRGRPARLRPVQPGLRRAGRHPPSSAPSLIVCPQLEPDPALTVGSAVAEGTSKVGTIVDLSGVERQALARYTQDAGNNVSLEVHPRRR